MPIVIEDEHSEADDGPTILEAFCRAQVSLLPRGSRGLKAAINLLTAIPVACRLGWSDMTVSAPQLFRMLKHAGLSSSLPIASDMPAALLLIESSCGLVTRRSARRWTVWFSSACDPDHSLGASIRKVVTPAMLRRPPCTAPSESPQSRSIRAERDQLAAELDSLKADFSSLRAAHAKTLSSHDVLEKKHNAFIQDSSAQKRQLEIARSNAQAEADRARHMESCLRYVNGSLESEKSDLEAEVAKLKEKFESHRKRFEFAGEELRRQMYRCDSLDRTIDRIQVILDIDSFESEAPNEFVEAVENVLSVYVGTIEKAVIRRSIAEVALRLCHKHDASVADISKYFHQNKPLILNHVISELKLLREDVAKEGVTLPPADVGVDDLLLAPIDEMDD